MTQTTPTRDEAVLYARYEPEWGRMMLCNRDQFGAVEYRLASAPAPASGGMDAVARKLLAATIAAAKETLAARLDMDRLDRAWKEAGREPAEWGAACKRWAKSVADIDMLDAKIAALAVGGDVVREGQK